MDDGGAKCEKRQLRDSAEQAAIPQTETADEIFRLRMIISNFGNVVRYTV